MPGELRLGPAHRPMAPPSLKLFGRAVRTGGAGFDRLTSVPGAGSRSLTVLEAQDDVPQVEASLLLRQGLVAGHFHDRPMGRRGRGAQPESEENHTAGGGEVGHASLGPGGSLVLRTLGLDCFSLLTG